MPPRGLTATHRPAGLPLSRGQAGTAGVRGVVKQETRGKVFPNRQTNKLEILSHYQTWHGIIPTHGTLFSCLGSAQTTHGLHRPHRPIFAVMGKGDSRVRRPWSARTTPQGKASSEGRLPEVQEACFGQVTQPASSPGKCVSETGPVQ